MDRELIIRLAREAGCKPFRSPEHWDDVQVFATPDVLERFAALVVAAERQRQEAHQLQQQAWNIDTQYASRLALMLECMVLDPRRWHDDALNVLDQYRSEWNKLNPSPSPFGKD